MLKDLNSLKNDKSDFGQFLFSLLKEISTWHESAIKITYGKKAKIEWPCDYGVYTLWKGSISSKNLLYVGLTGKYIRDDLGKVSLGGGNFSKRKNRYTPYRFCESQHDHSCFKYSFRYGPRYKGQEQDAKKYEVDAYQNSVSYNDLIILTINTSKLKDYSPSLLESLILTRYLFSIGDLPPANNQL